MKIAQVASLWESIPPRRYGGTERIVSYLTEELVRVGHDVTLFAAGDAVTAATLRAICPSSLRSTPQMFPDASFHFSLNVRSERMRDISI